MVAPVVLSALLFWGAVFVVFFTVQDTTPGEFLFGRYEPLPDDLGTWKERGLDAPTGLLREERLLLPSGNPNARRLLHQVRYRDPVTLAIARVDPEHHVRRRRISAR